MTTAGVQTRKGEPWLARRSIGVRSPHPRQLNPPSPLATAYIDLAENPLTQPALTDGFGHAFAYLDDSVLYTVVIWHPLFGENPVVLPDQSLAGGGGGGSSLTPFAGPPSGTINGTNTVFTYRRARQPNTTYRMAQLPAD